MQAFVAGVLGVGLYFTAAHILSTPKRALIEPPINPALEYEPARGVPAGEGLPRPVATIAPHLLDLGPTSFTIAWATRRACVGELKLHSYEATAVHREESPANYHQLEITGLEPGMHYCYEIGKLYRSEIRMPVDRRRYRVMVFGHTAGSMNANQYPPQSLAGSLRMMAPDFALCTGDITYFTTPPDFAHYYFDVFAEFLRTKPIYVAPGNHDCGFPTWPDFDYGPFRELFPRKYAADDGAYYSFTQGNVRFFALSYTMNWPGSFRSQMAWLRDGLESSDAEFNIVFLGGSNLTGHFKWDRFEELLHSLEDKVDFVLGGDGVGVFQETAGGVPYFYAGTSGSAPASYYLLEVLPWAVRIKLFDALGNKSDMQWDFQTKRKLNTVLELSGGRDISSEGRPSWAFEGMNVPSSDFEGVEIEMPNPRVAEGAALEFYWGVVTGRHSRGLASHFREQLVPITADTHNLIRIPLPRLNPNTGEEYVLSRIALRIQGAASEKGYGIKDLVSAVRLIGR